MAPYSPFDSARAKATGEKLAGLWRDRAVGVKAASFALIGVVNTAVDYCVFLLARAAFAHSSGALAAFDWLGEICRCGRPETILLIAANVTSWLVAVSGSYVMNSSITFAVEFGAKIALAPLSELRRFRHRRSRRQYHHPCGCRGISAAADLCRKSGRHPRELRRQFLVVALRGLPCAWRTGGRWRGGRLSAVSTEFDLCQFRSASYRIY